MKIEQVLILYLLKNKHISLQGIGSFRIDSMIPDNVESDKPVIIPPEAISFIYDPKTGEDDDLINFIVENTKKIKPLASADLDSFLTLGKHFLNIGNPFTIKNLGTLEKLSSGQLHFTPGPLIHKPEMPTAKIEDKGAEQHEENLFSNHKNEPRDKKNKNLFVILIIVLIVLGSWAIWNFGFKKNNLKKETTNEPIVPIADSANESKQKDSLAALQNIKDSIKNADNLKRNQTDSFTFRVVVYVTKNKLAGLARLEKLKNYGRNVIMYTSDSVTYKIAHPFTLPLSDTTKVLDSLNSFYYLGKAHIEKN